MTYEEAIRNINALNAVCGQKDFYDTEFEAALELAIEALEKQMSKKPYEKYEYMGNIGYGLNPTEYIKGYVCPTCGEWLEEGDHHCPCGQALLWEDTK